MGIARNLAALLDSSGDVVAGALDNAGGGGIWTLINSADTNGVNAIVEFTGITGYEEVMISIRDKTGNLSLQVSSNNGSSWNSGLYRNYFSIMSIGSGSSVHDGNSNNTYARIAYGGNSSAYNYTEVLMDVSTSNYKVLGYHRDGVANGRHVSGLGGQWTPCIVNAIRIMNSNGGTVDAKVQLYGRNYS